MTSRAENARPWVETLLGRMFDGGDQDGTMRRMLVEIYAADVASSEEPLTSFHVASVIPPGSTK
jgi:hypothetical protein